MAKPMSRLRVCVPALAAAGSVLFQLEPAHACGALPCAQVSDVLPPDGSAGVPRNTELRVLYFGSLESDDPACGLDLRQLRLLPSEGEPIDLTGAVLERPSASQAWVVAKAPEPLAPDTTYALQLELVDGVETCGCGQREWTTLASFTTSADEDHEAPSFTGIERVSYGERETGSNDCGENDGIPVLPSFSPPSDAAPAPRYDIYVDGELSKRYVALSEDTDGSREIFVDCGTTAFVTNIPVATGAAIEIRAVDLAGNESAAGPTHIVEASCDAATDVESEPTARPEVTLADGVPTSTDGDSDAAPLASPTAARSSGCAISGADRGSALALLAALPLLLRRRRHG